MDAATVVALVLSSIAAVTAAISLILNFREGSRRDEEIRLLRDEAGRREEEIGLFREQLDGERGERLEQQRAQLVCTRGTTQSDRDRVEYEVIVRNAGPSAATKVIIETEDYEHRPSRRGDVAAMLMPGESKAVKIEGHRRPQREGASADEDLAWALLVEHEVVLEYWDGLGFPSRADRPETRLLI